MEKIVITGIPFEISLIGKVSYFGKEMQKPTIGDKLKEFKLNDIKKNILLMYVTSFVSICCFSIIYLVYLIL